MFSVGIDIGGMSIKFGIVDNSGNIICKSSIKTQKDFDSSLISLVDAINNLLKDYQINIKEISGIGVGCPGAVNSGEGIIDFLPNIGWKNINIAKKLQEDFSLPIKISNDANVATLAEQKFGAAKGYNNVIMFTLGTGVGGGIVINGALYEGFKSRGAELGHVTLIADGMKCTCGRKGCVERYVSATALIDQTKKAMQNDNKTIMWQFVDNNIEKVDGKTAFECAKQGDLAANMVVDKYIFYLGESVLNMLNIFRPEAFVLGGGISAQGGYLIEKLTKYCEKLEYGYKGSPKTEILCAKLGNDAGIIGAACLVM